MKDQVRERAARMLRPAFMQPQLITWKSTRELDAGFLLDSVFARVSGISLGLFADAAELARGAAGHFASTAVHLHVFPRETTEDGLSGDEWARLDERREAFAVALRGSGVQVREVARPREGEFVLDVILGGEGEKIFLGAHVHGPGRHPSPGALPRLILPPEAPSRAWLKMEQALIWSGLDGPKALSGKTALELGSAPGGGTLSLLRRGMNVVGVDTADMAPIIAEEARARGLKFTHLRLASRELLREPLPRPVHVLVSDMNIAPPIMLRTVERIQCRVRALVLILMLKLNDREVERQIPRFLGHIEQFAPAPVRATQLAANRAEICVVAGEFLHGQAYRE